MNSIPALFVIGRFRSGTTLVWNILRRTEKTCAYYEPFNDNLLEHLSSDTKPMLSHTGVDSYWDAYQGIKNNIADKFDRRFGINRLCLGGKDTYSELQTYIEWLISSCKKGQLPVLQFNRADFRIPWLKSRFPDVPILYIYRDPREQWLSIVKEQPKTLQKSVWLNTGYDLLIWSANLLPYLPNTVFSKIRHSYDRHYILWKISYALGRHYADHRISLDNELHRDTKNGIKKILEAAKLDLHAEDFSAMVTKSQKYKISKSQSDWFKESESHCNKLLEDSGLLKTIEEDKIFSPETVLNQELSDVLNDSIYPVCHEISMHRRNAILSSGEYNNERISRNIEYQNEKEHSAALIKLIEEAEKYAKSLEKSNSQKDREIKEERTYRKKENSDSEKQIKSLTATLKKSEKYTRSLEESNSQKDHEIEVERNTRIGIQEDASKQIEYLKTELDKLRQEYSNEKAYRDKENSDAENQIKSLHTTLKESEKYTRSLEKSNSQKDREIEEERSARLSLQENASKQIEPLKAELDKLRQEFSNEKAYREKENSDAENQIKSLTATVKEAEKYTRSLEKSNIRKDHDIEEERNTRISVQENASKQIESLKTELDRLRQEFINEKAYRNKENSDAENQIKSLTATLKESEKYTRSLEKSNTQKDREVEEERIYRKKETRDSEKQIKSIKGSLEESEQYLQSLIIEKENLEKGMARLSEARERELTDAGLQIEALTTSMNEARTYTISLEKELQKTQKESKSQSLDISSLKDKFERINTEYNELSVKHEGYVRESDGKIRIMSEKLETEEVKMQALVAEVENLQEYLMKIESNKLAGMLLKLFKIDRVKP